MNLVTSIKKRLPTRPQENPALIQVRERILQMVLLAATIMGTLVYFTNLFVMLQSPNWLVFGVQTFVYAGLLLLTLATRMPLRIRASGLLFIVFILALAELSETGLLGEGRLFMATFALLTVILLDMRSGIIATVTGVVFIGVIGGLMTSGTLPIPVMAVLDDSSKVIEWVTGGAIFLLISGLLGAGMVMVIRGMNQAMQGQTELTGALTQERSMLELRVDERTATLQQRAAMMQNVADFSREVQKCSDADQIAALLVDTFSQKLKSADIAVFLSDPQANAYTLAASSGALAQAALQATGAIWVRQPGSLATLFTKQDTQILRNAGENSIYFNLPGLSELQVIVVIPMYTESASTGAIVLFFAEEPDTEEGQLTIYQSLANQAEIALEKATLFGALQKSVEELRIRGQQVTRKDWRGYIKSSRQSHALRLKDKEFETAAQRSQHANQAFRERRIVVQEQTGADTQPITTVAVPIMLRDEPFGVVDMRFEGSVPENLVNLVDAASRRLALALENARLVEQMQTRADREHAISAMAARIRASGDIDTILKVSAAEIGRSFGASEVLVQLRPTDTTEPQPVEQS